MFNNMTKRDFYL